MAYREQEKLFEGPITANAAVALNAGGTLQGDLDVAPAARIVVDPAGSIVANGKTTLGGATDLKLPADAPAEGEQAAGSLVIWLDATGKQLKFQVRFPGGTSSRQGSIALSTLLGPAQAAATTFGAVVKGKVVARAQVASPISFGAYSRGYRS